MEVVWSQEAKKEFLSFEKEIQEEIKKYKDKLPEKGIKWDKVGPVFKPEIGLKAFRIKINPKDNENLNHRIIFDVKDQKYVIYKVGNRSEFYNQENLKEVKDRK